MAGVIIIIVSSINNVNNELTVKNLEMEDVERCECM